MTEQSEETKDTAEGSTPETPKPAHRRAARPMAASDAGCLGSVVGAVAGGLVSMIVGIRTSPGWMTDPDMGAGPLLGLPGMIVGALAGALVGVIVADARRRSRPGNPGDSSGDS